MDSSTVPTVAGPNSSTVHILVGSETEILTASEDALSKHTNFFTDRIRQRNSDGAKNIELSGYTLTAVKVCLHWLLNNEKLPEITSVHAHKWLKRLQAGEADAGERMCEDDEYGRCFLADWIEAYLLAQDAEISKLRNVIMRRMCHFAWDNRQTKTIAPPDAMLGWDHGGKKLRAFILDAVYINTKRPGGPSVERDFEELLLRDGRRGSFWRAWNDSKERWVEGTEIEAWVKQDAG